MDAIGDCGSRRTRAAWRPNLALSVLVDLGVGDEQSARSLRGGVATVQTWRDRSGRGPGADGAAPRPYADCSPPRRRGVGR